MSPLSIKNKLKRDQNKYIHQKVDVIVTKEFPSFHILGKHIGPFKLGHPMTIDQYIARILVEEGIVKFDDTKHLNRKGIQKINFQESTNPELGKIAENFIYTQAREQLEIMNKLYEQGKIPRQEFKQLLSDVNDLIRVRLAKINRLAVQTGRSQSERNLTQEERILFDEIASKINEWKTALGKVNSKYN
ncbi:MAG: DNA replication complex GINS family protein [Candidatus Lokiarchaeota archaeon]|nr:DNA replication complex GINS family protein [Candidatus Harpocratesius repetitus]